MFGRFGEDDRRRRWIWKGMDMQLLRSTTLKNERFNISIS
jgi:hypothetical protein